MDLLMIVLGWLAHHIKVLIKIKDETGQLLWPPNRYIKKRPLKFALSITGTIIGGIFVVFSLHPDTQTLIQNESAAWGVYLAALAGVGILGDAVIDKIGSFTANKM